MSSVTIDELLERGIERHRAGDLTEAEEIYRQILSTQPNHAGALHALGVLTCQAGQLQEALALINRLIQIKPHSAEAYNNLGVALKGLKRFDEAIRAFTEALKLKPDYAEAHDNLGAALFEKGELDQAIASFNRAIQLTPGFAKAVYNLGISFEKQGRLDEAVIALCKAVGLTPDYADAHNSLGNVLRAKGKLNDAALAYSNAIRFKPGSAEAYSNLGIVFEEQGRFEDAAAMYSEAIKLKPDFAEAHNNLGNALDKVGKLEESLAAYAVAVKLNPDFALAQNNLGCAFNTRGHVEESLACYRRAIAADPGMMSAHSNYLYAMHFHPDWTADAIYEEHRGWDLKHAAPLKKFQLPHINDRAPDRKLRIGYISPDFKEHPVGRFFLPLMLAHDPRQFEITCYSAVLMPDNLTWQLRDRAARWREITRMPDAQVASLIRADQIDILIDLAGHTAGNRLAVFAYKPAPVQVTWLGYPDTTGLSCIDYRLTDIHADPPGITERFHSEQLIRLPETFLCFRPDDQTIGIAPTPALERGQITFGSFNILPKINGALVELWSQILQQTPGSRMLIKSRYLADASAQRHLSDLFSAFGIQADRLEFRRAISSYSDHLRQYDHVDIALDTYPYHGTTTTCEALWMGVPVVTRVGDRHQCRVGSSLLNNVGLPQLAAHSHQEYVRIAVGLANDLPRLSVLRQGLRDQMRQSPLMDAARFSRNVEKAYRQMWRQWCD